jgi:sigma-E factor negative regulatory protein RseA
MTNELDNQPPGARPAGDGERSLVSALADGQLRGREFARAVAEISGGGDARATWHTYHVVGDVLRSGELSACGDDAAFLARFQARLQRETDGAVPVASASFDSPVTNSKSIANYSSRTWEKGVLDSKTPLDAANHPRWKMLAGVASVAVVGAIAWSMVGAPSGPAAAPPAAAQLAQAPEQPQVMIRDPHLDALLAAHKQFGGTSALQMPAGFLRNATFESPAR